MALLYGLCLFAASCGTIKVMIATQQNIREAAEYLKKHDQILRPIIEKCGTCAITPHADYYRELVESIVGQQLSVQAAASIRRKFVELYGGTFPSPQTILTKTPEELRAVGLSWAKAAYVSDLARHVISGKVHFDHLDNLSNDEIITELTGVKGIGEWTVHMFLIFCMGRLDVLPTGDLGIRNGVRALYHLNDAPAPAKIIEIAEENHWHPYESVAAWYVWESLDNMPKA